jgi:valyl-tRNA synthetase
MSGYSVLWVPGTDHAGIATQNVVEKQLAAGGIDRHQIGRSAFIEQVWKWKAESGGRILHQLKRLGASCDWSRERFTLDEGLSKAVREVFVRLYELGLIYQDNRLINWCPRCLTALSDLEVEHEELDGKLTYIRYPLANENSRHIIVATTRPETMLGDTAVAVNPADERYHDVIGKTIALPLTNRQIPVIADPAVDPSFGTGAVKVTPAHDFNDEQIAKRQAPSLQFLSVIGKDGRMTADAGERYAGLDRYACRKLVHDDLQQINLIEREETHRHAIGHCYRCKTITEPLSTLQWYVNVHSMAHDAISAVREGKIRIIPDMWENTFFAWMEDIKDWCISRQIWWGHQLPVWYCQQMLNDSCKSQRGIIVSRIEPQACPFCGSEALTRDQDVLDTWFSSALWPFSTLGWPDETEDLKTFYPTSVLVTAFDIIFFWVARMIMMGMQFMHDVPFRDVYIHAIIRDSKGQKMSKSKGNVLDPLIMMDRYGTDAFRFTLAAFAAQGRDIRFSEDRVEGYRHFVNKLWNASRFIMMNTKGSDQNKLLSRDALHSSLPGRWILSRLAATSESMNASLREYRFNDAVSSIYQFVWHEFCDWYIEMSKIEFPDTRLNPGTRWCLLSVLDSSLRLLHPFMPFVTEEIWQKIRESGLQGIYPDAVIPQSIMVSAYPQSLTRDLQSEEEMSHIIDAVMGIRTIRGELNISPALKLSVSVRTSSRKTETVLMDNIHYIKALSRAAEISVGPDISKPACSATAIKGSMEIYVSLKGVLNIAAEIDRLKKERAKVDKDLVTLNRKLFNEDFLQRAPRDIIEKEKAKHEELVRVKDKITDSINMLKEAEG